MKRYEAHVIAIVIGSVLLVGMLVSRRKRRRKLQALVRSKQADVERVLRKLLVLALNDPESFCHVRRPAERTKGISLIELWPSASEYALLKRFEGCNGVQYVIDIYGVAQISTLYPPEGKTCDESWFRNPMEALFERFSPISRSQHP
jgi:hypothetical protein